jgi:hypothetical protein
MIALGYNWNLEVLNDEELAQAPPTVSLATKWLRIEKGAIVSTTFDDKGGYWFWDLYIKVNSEYIFHTSDEKFSDPEECDAAALDYALDYLTPNVNYAQW